MLVGEGKEFFEAFAAGVITAGSEIRDHWHPDDDTAVTYKLPEPRSGKTMRYTVKYTSMGNAEAGSRALRPKPLLDASTAAAARAPLSVSGRGWPSKSHRGGKAGVRVARRRA